jgi:hypothetical protein
VNKYTFRFYGRTRGALGISSTFQQTVYADTREAAEIKLYDTHDHIMCAQLMDFWAPGMPEKKEE